MEMVDFYTDFDFFDQTNTNFIFETTTVDCADTMNCLTFDPPPNEEEFKLTGDGDGEVPSTGHLSGSPIQISFGKPHFQEPLTSKVGVERRRTPNEIRGRIMAERKRREKLNENFISLSSLIPGLKKMDKGSIMKDAITYLKRLQDSVDSLEKNVDNNSCKFENSDDDNNNPDSFGNEWNNQYATDIKTTVSNRNILIQIYCKKVTGIEATMITEIESLGLTVSNSNFMQFGQKKVSITVAAKMNDGFNVSMEDLVKILGRKISGPMNEKES